MDPKKIQLLAAALGLLLVGIVVEWRYLARVPRPQLDTIRAATSLPAATAMDAQCADPALLAREGAQLHWALKNAQTAAEIKAAREALQQWRKTHTVPSMTHPG